MVKRFAATLALAALVLCGCGGPAEVRAVAAGRLHSLAVDGNGCLWAWGANESGQLGDGTTSDRSHPARVKGLSGVVAAAGGAAHTTALRKNGTVWTWGANEHGQLGDGSTASRAAPGRVAGLEDVIALAAGAAHTAALGRDGTVWTWGRNGSGELGDGTTRDRARPGRVEGLPFIRAISCGAHHTAVLDADGAVWAWGPNGDGRLGDGTTEDRLRPVRAVMPGDARVTAIVAGGYHTVALTDSGNVLAWGANWSEAWQLANATTLNSPRPTPVAANEGLEAIGWPVIPTKEPVRPLGEIAQVTAGAFHTLAVRRDGLLLAWGQNARWGQLGSGAADWQPSVTPVRGIVAPRAFAGGMYHSLAVAADGSVFAWGGNHRGQLGIGTADMTPHGAPERIGAWRTLKAD